jgi:NCAIR mutase (PurE)-related protein
MKNFIYVIVVAIIASACSAPKYTASFNSYDKHVSNQMPSKTVAVASEQQTVAQPEQLLASTSTVPVEMKSTAKVEEVRKTYIQMTKTERKALRTHLKSEIKSYVKEQKKNLGIESAQATGAWDNDLKMAAIFGVVGIIGTALWGASEVIGIIGTIALIIAVVFLVKWLIRQ